MMTREEIAELRERLRASRLELLTEIAERDERHAVDHEHIVAATTREAPPLMFKVRDNNSANGNGAIGTDNGSIEAPPLTDLQIDILAGAFAELRREFLDALEAELAPLRAELAELRALRDDLLTMIDAKRKALGRKRSTTRLLAPPK